MAGTTPNFAMPVGLPADPATAVAHFVELRLYMEAQKNSDGTGSIWVDDNALYSNVFTLTSGIVRYVPAGGSGPVGGPVAVPTLFIIIWPQDYLFLKGRAAGAVVPRFIQYTHLDPAEVTSAITALVASNPRWRSIDAASGGNLVQEVLANRKALLLRSSVLLGRPLVDPFATSPTRVGKRRLDIAFIDEAGDVIDLATAFDLFRAVGGPLVDSHPLLEDISIPCTASVAPVEGETWVRIALAPGSTQPANARVTLRVGGVQASLARMDSARDAVFALVPPHAAGAVDLSIDIAGEASTRNYQLALTFVEEIGPTFDALRASCRNALEFVEDRVAATAGSGAVLTDIERVELEAQLDLSGDRRRGLLTRRAAATGTSLFDPQLAQFEESVYAGLTARLSKVREDLWVGSTPPSPLPTVSARPLRGFDFFQSIRAVMDSNRGFFAGQDQDVTYACADASFHRFRLHARPRSLTLPDAVLALPASARAVSNAAFFSESNPWGIGRSGSADYCETLPCDSELCGDAIVGGVALSGWTIPWKTTSFGQMAGVGQAAFAISPGDATAHATPGPYLDGLSGMVSLLSGKAAVYVPSADLAQQGIGRVFFGIHRASNTVFIAAINHVRPIFRVTSTVTSALEFAQRMEAAGVDELVMGDGSDSVKMWVHNGTSHKLVAQSFNPLKDNTNPVAAYFSLGDFLFGPGALATVNAAGTTAGGWASGAAVTGISGSLRLVAGGAELRLDSLGNTTGGVTIAVGSALGVTLPVSLRADTSNLTVQSAFREPVSGRMPLVSAVLTWPADPLSRGALVGDLLIETANGAVSMAVHLPLAPIP